MWLIWFALQASNLSMISRPGGIKCYHMAVLHNRVNQAELKQRLYEESEPRLTISFYKYFRIKDPVLFRNELYKSLNEIRVFGRIYVADEGINAQVSVPASNFENFRDRLYAIPELNGLRLNVAVDHGKSFWVLKVKVRNKIVADGIEDPGFSIEERGTYLNAEEFNRMTDDPDTIVVDMRNHYEYEVGHFEKAIEVPSDTFREQLPMAVDMLKGQEDKKIIMYCTGGIRCEKASAYMLYRGFQNVYHLEGGIIHYANKVKENGLPNKFRGKNFVFDERLGERISEEIIAVCHQCGKPCDTHTNCANQGCHLLFIQCEECAKAFTGCCSRECAEVLSLPEEEQKLIRKGIDKGRMVFNKSKQRRNEHFNDSAEDLAP